MSPNPISAAATAISAQVGIHKELASSALGIPIATVQWDTALLLVGFALGDAAAVLAVAVLLENGKQGSAAGLIARKVFDAYLLPPAVSSPAEPVATPPAGGTEE